MKHPFFADIFAKDAKLPNKGRMPEYLARIATPTEMLRNFPRGPSTARG
jgi:hypothetical protein